MRLWDAYFICDRDQKNLRVKLKDGKTYEGEIECYTDGELDDTGDDSFLLAGPKGTTLYRDGDVMKKICESHIVEMEIIDRE